MTHSVPTRRSSDLIASDGNGVAGIATDFPSKRKAKKGAISECKKRGGGKCKIWRTFMNQCAAVIAGEGLSATANAPTKREAIDLGLEQCRRSEERPVGKECIRTLRSRWPPSH